MKIIDDTPHVLERMKRRYSEMFSPCRGLKLPGAQSYSIIDGNSIEISISDAAVCSNMQTDAAAFEGWAMVMKYICGYEKVYLKWESANPQNRHYQRFLFRVINFHHFNPEWFFVSNCCESYCADSDIRPGVQYYLNTPCGNRKNSDARYTESKMEFYFADPQTNGELREKTGAFNICRQLPVGVFKNSVKKGNEIFTGGKSAIDLWGMTKTDDLLLFELKAAKNYKVGIISELLFYIEVMLKVRAGQFINEGKPVDSFEKIRSCKKIKAYFLAPNLHPLLHNEKNQIILGKLNVMIKDVEFHYMQVDEKMNLKSVY